jgi:glycosyltransferase involved in cell wall biosynthesis
MRIAICIGTFQRRELLRNLLTGISQLTFCKVPTPEIEVIVVDNDASGSAREICEAVELPWRKKYVIEPRRGIAYVRNRALHEAGNTNLIAFIDDDEVPCALWLDELLWTQRKFSADVVTGPVLPRFATGVADWVKQGEFFERPKYETGDSPDLSSTNNALVRTEVFSCISGFDDQFQLTGGEDIQFFLRVARAGYRIIWSQDAAVFETVSKERASFAWILHRGYQGGNSWALCESSLDGRARVRMARFAKACVHVVGGVGMVLIGFFSGRAGVSRALQRACLGAGMLTGLFGRKYLAYASNGAAPIEQNAKLEEQTYR